MPTQVVQVDIGAKRTFAYRWHGKPDDNAPLNIGDRVLLPGNFYTPEPFWGVVAAFGEQGYTGPLAEIMERGLPKKETSNYDPNEPPF